MMIRRPSFAAPLALTLTALTALAACTDNNVYVSRLERRNFVNGSPNDVTPRNTGPESATAIFTVNGMEQRVTATFVDNVATLTGVPAGPYLLELQAAPNTAQPSDPRIITHLPIDGTRRVEIGERYAGHGTATQMTDTDHVTLDVTAPATFRSGDQITWVSQNAYLYRTVTFDPSSMRQTNVPAEGATAATGWTLPATELISPYGPEASGLPNGASDDLLLLHTHDDVITQGSDRFDPWHSFDLLRVVGVLNVSSPAWTAGGANNVTGAFTPPSASDFTLDFRGSSFAPVRAAFGTAVTVNSQVSIELDQEFGTGPGFYTSPAPMSWNVFASSQPIPVDPTCYPNDAGECDSSCTAGCNAMTSGVRDPGDVSYTFSAPRAYTNGMMRDVLSVSYAFRTAWRHPTTMQSAQLTASATLYRTLATQSGPITLELGPVQNIRVAGMVRPLDMNSTGIGTSPTITFDAPVLGTAERYGIELIEQTPDADSMPTGGRARRTAGRFTTLGTSITIPEGLLRAGHFYYVRISAVRDGRTLDKPYWSQSDSSIVTQAVSGVFSP